jgi:hypothetical protein
MDGPPAAWLAGLRLLASRLPAVAADADAAVILACQVSESWRSA